MYFSRSLSRPLESRDQEPEHGGQNSACWGLTMSSWCRADGFPQVMVTRSPTIRSREMIEPLSDSISHRRITRNTDLQNTHSDVGGTPIHQSREEAFLETHNTTAQLSIDLSALSLTG